MYVDLDWATDGDLQAQLAEAHAVLPRVTFTVVSEHGPASGNPVVRFEAEDAQDLRIAVYRYCDSPASAKDADRTDLWYLLKTLGLGEQEAAARR